VGKCAGICKSERGQLGVGGGNVRVIYSDEGRGTPESNEKLTLKVRAFFSYRSYKIGGKGKKRKELLEESFVRSFVVVVVVPLFFSVCIASERASERLLFSPAPARAANERRGEPVGAGAAEGQAVRRRLLRLPIHYRYVALRRREEKRSMVSS